jgi:hypothetical protein
VGSNNSLTGSTLKCKVSQNLLSEKFTDLSNQQTLHANISSLLHIVADFARFLLSLFKKFYFLLNRMTVMKCLKPLYKTIALACGLVFAAGLHQVEALTIPTDELITNGGFGSSVSPNLNGWVTVGTANARARNNPINTAGGNAGFNNFFGSATVTPTNAFAVLGDAAGTGQMQIGGDPSTGISSISQTFILDGTNIRNYNLTLSFQSVFDGRDDNIRNDGTANTPPQMLPDIFKVLLNGTEYYKKDSLSFPSGTPTGTDTQSPLDDQIIHNGSISLPVLLPGTYTLSFILDEASGTGLRLTNTAVGIDNVSLTGYATPMVPEPGTFVLLGGGLVALGLLGRNRKRS